MIAEILQRMGATDRSRAVPMRELERQTGLNEREIYKRISQERTDESQSGGPCICGKRNEGGGYWLSDRIPDLEDQVRLHEQTGKKLLTIAQRMREHIKKIKEQQEGNLFKP